MADEEMEDVIYECRAAGEAAICPTVLCVVENIRGRSYYVRASND